jgi:hypothetical protein
VTPGELGGLVVVAARVQEAGQQEGRVGLGGLRARRLAQLRQRPRLVAELVGGARRQQPRARVARPLLDRRAELGQRLLRMTALEREAAAQDAREGRLLELRDDRLRLVVPPEVHEHVGARELVLLRVGREREGLVEGAQGAFGLSTRAAGARQLQPALRVAARPRDLLHHLVAALAVAAGDHPPGQHEPQALVVRHLLERLLHQGGRVVLALDQVVRLGGDREQRQVVRVARQALLDLRGRALRAAAEAAVEVRDDEAGLAFARRVVGPRDALDLAEELLRLVEPAEGHERARLERLVARVLGLQRHEALRGLEGPLRVVGAEGGLRAHQQRGLVLGVALEHAVRGRDGLLEVPHLGEGGGEQEPRRARHGIARGGALQGEHRGRRAPGVDQREAEAVVRLGVVGLALEQLAQRRERLGVRAGVLERSNVVERLAAAPASERERCQRRRDRPREREPLHVR